MLLVLFLFQAVEMSNVSKVLKITVDLMLYRDFSVLDLVLNLWSAIKLNIYRYWQVGY